MLVPALFDGLAHAQGHLQLDVAFPMLRVGARECTIVRKCRAHSILQRRQWSLSPDVGVGRSPRPGTGPFVAERSEWRGSEAACAGLDATSAGLASRLARAGWVS